MGLTFGQNGQILLPPAPSQSKPGPAENLLDGLLAQIHGGPFGIFDDVRNFLHGLLHPIAAGIDVAIGVVWDVATSAAGWVWHLGIDAANAVAYAISYAGQVAQLWAQAVQRIVTDLISAVDAAWKAGLTFVGGLLNAAISAVDAAWKAGLTFVSAVLNAAIGVVDAAWRAAVSFTSTALNAAIGVVDAAWRAAVSFTSTALNAAIGAVDWAWRNALSLASEGLHTAIQAVEWGAHQALGLLESTVINPLMAEWHLFRDHVLPDVLAVLDVIRKCWDWLVALAEYGLTDTIAGVQSVAGWRVADVRERVGSVYASQRPHLARMSRGAA